jgi:alkylhydroperoxidase family enzyme
MIYPDADVARAVGEDPQSAPIPELHKAMFQFAELFVKRSWQATPEDLNVMRTNGASDRDLAEWLQIASIQTWFTHSADAGGIPMDGDAVKGPVMARERSFYHAQPDATSQPATHSGTTSPLGWIDAPCTGAQYENAESWAMGHYGFTPNLFKSISGCSDFYLRHQRGLELLDAPVSKSIPSSLHALVRATVIALDRSGYFEPTAHALLRRETEGATGLDILRADPVEHIQDQQAQVVLQFVHKMTKNAYKIIGGDAQSFRDAGMNDEAYVEVFNTVAIQQSLDRLANCIGVAADAEPLVAR